MATDIGEIDVVIKKKKCSSADTCTIKIIDGSVQLSGAGGADESRYFRQIGDLVNAAVTGTLQSVVVTNTASGSPNLTVIKRVCASPGGTSTF